MGGDSGVRHASTVHGGSLFAAGRDGEFGLRSTPAEIPEAKAPSQPLASNSVGSSSKEANEALLGVLGNGAPSWDSVVNASSWTVHDGNFFATAMREGLAHTPQERRFVESPQVTIRLDEDRVKWKKLSESTRRAAANDHTMISGSMTASAAQSVRILAPDPVSKLGKDASSLKSFTLESTIGMGQFAAVHRARRNKDQLQVALKLWHRPVSLIHPGAAPDDERKRRPSTEPNAPPCDSEDVACFEQEVAMLHVLNPNRIDGLVNLLAYGFVDDGSSPEVRGFMVMELIKGEGDLRKVMRTCKPSYARIARWTRQLAATLAEMHARGIVHRDVKESNVMLDTDDRTVLVDLGLAIRLPVPEEGTALTATTTYQSFLQVGVLGYMAPEVHRKRAYGAPVDVFAFGVVLRKLLSRVQAPPSKGSLLRRICLPALYSMTKSSYAYEEIHCKLGVSTHPEWPAVLATLSRECCAVSPDARPTFKEVLRRLDEAAL